MNKRERTQRGEKKNTKSSPTSPSTGPAGYEKPSRGFYRCDVRPHNLWPGLQAPGFLTLSTSPARLRAQPGLFGNVFPGSSRYVLPRFSSRNSATGANSSGAVAGSGCHHPRCARACAFPFSGWPAACALAYLRRVPAHFWAGVLIDKFLSAPVRSRTGDLERGSQAGFLGLHFWWQSAPRLAIMPF
jgi:hypothetical protein